MKQKILYLLLGLFVQLGLTAETIRFTASAPSTVILDRPFQLVYSVNSSARDLRVPEINYFDILAGPFESHSSSIQYVNGKSSSSESVSFTYTLQAQKTGTFTIPSASIVVGGQKFTSNGVSIKVLPADAAGAGSAKSQGSAQTSTKSGSQSISNENVFIKTTVSKANVYEQEPILVTYKLYTLVDVVQCANKKMPDFNGFMKQDIEQNQNKQFSYENFNGKNYGTVVLYSVLLYPQHSGVIEIGKANFEAVIRVQNRAQVRSIFDDFFDSYSNVSKNIIAPATRLSISALPSNKPSSFNGTVGHFNLNANISSTQTKANEAITLKINISGAGNMKLIKTPTIKFPDGFETYDPKVVNNFKTTSAGISGSKSIEYMFIPRHSGNFEIPPVEFSYFDTQDKSYKVLTTPSYKLAVAKGDGVESSAVVGTFVDKQDVKQLGKDIRYIVTEPFELDKEEVPLIGSIFSWVLFLIPVLIALALFVFFRKQVIENANESLMKNKKANKVAQKRLKLAQKLLLAGNKDKFYEEVLKSVWTYLSDKLSIPVASLTKDQVVLELSANDVEESVISQFTSILNTCEFARYAPNSGQQEMGNLYDETILAISNLENKYKKN